MGAAAGQGSDLHEGGSTHSHSHDHSAPPARVQQTEPHRAALVLILGFMGVERLEESRPFRRRRNRVRIDCDVPRLLDR